MLTTHEIDWKILNRDIDELVETPVIVRVNKFKEEAAKEFAQEISAAVANPQQVIPVVIDSYGGYCYSLFQMIDTIRHCPKPVMTIVEGKAMSCGSVLASCGTKGMRYMAPTSTFMIHDVSSGAHGKIEEIKADAKEAERIQKLFLGILDANAGKPQGYFEAEILKRGRADWYLTPTETQAVGLIDHVGLPTIKTTITVTQEIL